MKPCHFHRKRRPATFRPRLHALENRLCPSCDVSVIDGNILQILGDQTANRIEIRQTSDGVTDVSCDGTSASFSGINAFDIATGAGNDFVTANFINPPEPEFNFRADLGAGDDSFTATFFPETISPPPSDLPPGPCRIDVFGQQGNDRMSVFLGGPDTSPQSHVFNAELSLNFDGGLGNDTALIDITNVTVNAPMSLTTNLGGGSDIAALNAYNAALNADIVTKVLSGDGGDTVGIIINGCNVATGASLAVNTDGGDGGDTVGIIIDGCNVATGASLLVDEDGGGGADTVGIIIDGCTVARDALFSIEVHGGGGADVLRLSTVGLLVDGTFSCCLDGGDGNDVIYTRLDFDANSRGTVDAEVMGGAGDDQVTASLQSVPQSDFVIRADLGGGNNIFDAVLVQPPEPEQPGEVQPPEPDRQALIDVTAGAGNDQVIVTFFDIFSDTDVRVDLGAGNDTFQGTVAIANLGGASGPAPMQIDPGNFTVTMNVLGRTGDDVLGLQIGGPGSSPEAFWLNSDLSVNFDGGYGNDSAVIVINNVAVNGSILVNQEGAAGADTSSIIIDGGTVAAGASLDVSANGGAGGDALSIGGIMPCWLPGSRSHFTLAGDDGSDTIDATVQPRDDIGGEVGIIIIGGFGNDQIRAEIMPCAVLGGVLDVMIAGDEGNDAISATLREAHTDGQFNLNIIGGAGSDVLFIGGIMPCIEPEGQSSIRLSGDGGNDIIRGDLQTDADSQEVIAIIIEGGLGDDDLTLAISGLGGPDTFQALVDGGDGHDIAHVTRNVLVRNCEEVFFIE